jgi:hypothetical protein
MMGSGLADREEPLGLPQHIVLTASGFLDDIEECVLHYYLGHLDKLFVEVQVVVHLVVALRGGSRDALG